MSDSTLALLSFGGCHLLLPRQSIASIETIADLDPGAIDFDRGGRLRLGGQEWPVYALDAELRCQHGIPPGYRYCVGINHRDRPAFAMLCEEVGTVDVADCGEARPLPDCMRLDDSPVTSLLIQPDRVMLVSDAESMARFLDQAIRVAA